MRAFCITALALGLAAAAGCSSSEDAEPSATGGSGGDDAGSDAPASDAGSDRALPDGGPLGGDRPVTPIVPASYDPSVPTPLVIMLHGYGASGLVEEFYLGLTELAQSRGFIYLTPDGTFDADKRRFWNATDACCNFGNIDVDDSSYLQGLIDEAKAAYNIDPKRVYFIGHSNGGFMSHRMACEHADSIAAIVSLAGAMYTDISRCNPSEPVSVLQVHGTEDVTITYAGGTLGQSGAAYPSATTTVEDWAGFDGCSLTPTTGTPFDFVDAQPGDETSVLSYDSGCQPGGHAELWSVQGEGHIPGFNQRWKSKVIDFLYAHPKP